MKVRRAAQIFIRLATQTAIDLNSILRGQLQSEEVSVPVAACPLAGGELTLSPDARVFLDSLSVNDWINSETALGTVSVDELDELIAKGLVITDRDLPPDRELRSRDDVLRNGTWHPYAFLYHSMARRGDPESDESSPADLSELAREAREALRLRVEQVGPAPAAIFRLPSVERIVELPRSRRSGELFDLLESRSTVRVFEPDREIPMDKLSTLLSTVWGSQGKSHPVPGLELLKKTSPSGGALHPTEVFPLIIQVENLESGLYHYDLERHALELIEPLTLATARELADKFAAWQVYPRFAAAIFLMTTRFERTFWKYRNQVKAYRVACMDAAHLSQTFYLVCSHLGLGPFFSAAIDDTAVDAALGLDGVSHGAMALCGCGVPARSGVNLGLRVDEPGR